MAVKVLIQYLQSNPRDSQNDITVNLGSRYKSKLQEAVPEKDNTSYTVDKKETHVCLNSRDSSQKLYDINLLMYVCIHEISHQACDSIGHTPEFYEVFEYLLSKSIDCGIYTFDDYSKNPVNYCDLEINTQILV